MKDSCPGKGSERLMFKADNPQFFKIILDDNNRKLAIPRKFIRSYGNYLSSPAVLKVPTGAKWRVGLNKCSGEIWFDNGWQEFVKYYSLAHGSLVVFEYDKKNCHFNVIIFDKSASEIDYPYDVSNGDTEEPNNLEKEFPKPKTEEETETDVSVEILDGFSLSRKRKVKSPLPCSQPPKKMKPEKPSRNSEGLDFAAKKVNGGLFSEKQRLDGVVVRRQPLTAKEKATAHHRANTNFKSENPFFIIAMQPSYVHYGAKLAIPANFVRNYFKQKRGKAALSTLDGKSWSVEYYYCVSNGKATARLGNGWREFSEENNLEVGDICVFELIIRTKITFKVVILRDSKRSSSSPSLGNSKKLKQEKNLSCRQFIPRNSCSESPGATEAAKNFTSLNPFFKVLMKPCYLRSTTVNVPLTVVAKCTKQRVEYVTLQVENRRWPVKLVRDRSHGRRQKMSGGWISFARENSLQEGDVCCFELINSETMLLKVSIFRNV
ncbi:B3 domain-containing transcription factor VRN1 isoform X1 [Jatropha curcas]|nr:B3 domain-containing transcription factor VRN1 isoform X1 [Jatropha curcas]